MKAKLGKRLLTLLLAAAVAAWFLVSLHSLQLHQQRQGAQQLETALRRAAVACYAMEGFYPPDLAYLQAHYGVQVDEGRYVVHYDVFAENLMPQITVLEREV